METSAVAKASFSLNVREIANDISYKFMALFMQQKGCFDHLNRASKKFTLSLMTENDLLASSTNTIFLIDLVLL